MIVKTELFQAFCEQCRVSGTLTTDESLAAGQDTYHDDQHHSQTNLEGEDS